MKRLTEKTVFCGFVTAWRLRRLTDKPLAGLRKCHHRWCRARTLGILQNNGLPALHHRHAGVRSAQINSQNLRHNI